VLPTRGVFTARSSPQSEVAWGAVRRVIDRGAGQLRPERRLRLSPRSVPRSGFNCEHAHILRLTGPSDTGRGLDVGDRSSPCDAHCARRGLHAYCVSAKRDDHAGGGRGSALLEDIVRCCERAGVGAYLESSTERNRMLYRRFGFDVIEELNWPGGGPPFWRMLRPAP